ncbi:GNAT family N-acetyltransferase [Clostridium sp. LY3-2]|uniref:GNAT family N-acetyltransferase n=1 Tax=Clostridium sp. LY3-2 TaxID=2942482 RepID=UPI0021522F3D|nr:GNAT family N-acetyltransferase [Clostridium sp. LY3-2]MCR6514414.1 GNAT family N-acetyltransferase [Clostridium sp. LY3-2]
MKIRSIKSSDNKSIEKIIKDNLKSFNLDIPGTAYFDPEISTLSDFYKLTNKRDYFVFVDDLDNVLGGVGIAEYDEKNNICELQKLSLSNESKGNGASYKLLDAAINFAKEAGYTKIYLETYHTLEAAVHLYRKYGFKELEKPLISCNHDTMDMFFIKDI